MEPNSSAPTPGSTKQSRTVLVVTLALAVLAIAVVAAVLINGNSSAPSATTQNGTTTITYTNEGFSPSTLTVKKGTKITVVNNSSDPVQFSSADHPTHQENPELNMAELAPGESGSFTVSIVGTHGFHDHNDDSKTGTLVVTER